MATSAASEDEELIQEIQLQTRQFLDQARPVQDIFRSSPKQPSARIVSPFFEFSLDISSGRLKFERLRVKVLQELRRCGMVICRNEFTFRSIDGDVLKKRFVEPGDVIFVSMRVQLNVSGIVLCAWMHDMVSLLEKRVCSFMYLLEEKPCVILFLNKQPLDSKVRLMNYGIRDGSILEAHFCQ